MEHKALSLEIQEVQKRAHCVSCLLQALPPPAKTALPQRESLFRAWEELERSLEELQQYWDYLSHLCATNNLQELLYALQTQSQSEE